MNERIKELAEQAESFAETAYNKQTMATFHTNKSAEEIFREKFAELIVRECAEVGHDSVEDGDDIDAIMRRVHNNILKHFGVEE